MRGMVLFGIQTRTNVMILNRKNDLGVHWDYVSSVKSCLYVDMLPTLQSIEPL